MSQTNFSINLRLQILKQVTCRTICNVQVCKPFHQARPILDLIGGFNSQTSVRQFGSSSDNPFQTTKNFWLVILFPKTPNEQITNQLEMRLVDLAGHMEGQNPKRARC